MADLKAAPTAPRLIIAAAAGVLVVLLATLLSLGLLTGRSYSAPSGLRAPGTPFETTYQQRMGREGREVAFFEGNRVAVLVPEKQWAQLGQAGRYERLRFLSDCKAGLVNLQHEMGDKIPYTMTVQSRETHRLLAEETDFNPQIFD